ncbi:hypothetical protein H9P43_001301 [Blastocladiella emersonii ATCC 22665]|nr:hypothetical protein H9P43_001301 [Blastocladiella emersonii ATCC 22665]
MNANPPESARPQNGRTKSSTRPGAVETASSLPLQILISLNETYLPLVVLETILSLIYKGLVLPYPPYLFGLEMALAVLVYPLETMRFFFGAKGNLTESASSLALFLALLCMTPFLSIFFLAWQVYVLSIDVWIHAIALALAGGQALYGVSMLVFLIRNRF